MCMFYVLNVLVSIYVLTQNACGHYVLICHMCLRNIYLQGDKDMADVTHVIVDEVHERSLLVS